MQEEFFIIDNNFWVNYNLSPMPRKARPKFKLKSYLFLIPLVILFGVGFYLKTNIDQKNNFETFKSKTIPSAIEKIITPGTKFTVDNLKESSGIYEFELTLGEGANAKKYISYITKDGALLFSSGIKVADLGKTAVQGAQASQAAQKPVPKNDKPVIELFVMSYCPYGTQMEKGILPVLDALGQKINFALKFVSYAMHGEKEIDENLKQYCIEKNQPSELNNYLKCFLQSGNTNDCNSNLDLTTINNCVAQTDSQFKIKEKFNDKNSWSNSQFPPFDVNKNDNTKYGVQGSPTLVINGVTSNSSRDPQGLLEAICSAFTNSPSECNNKLPTDEPAPGFGDTTQAASTNSGVASCN
ncbi:MAG: hypothetical protein ABH816_02085 [Candidatus Levyibacteriota bacterium]